ncbi:uncharacterized protein MONOS_10199 [Monocercomonoides exilis]|uniref:uncharacterized protein n=1 Tax=Monocercomonoides exilis TaxID=2049356 RepID=UPI00355AB5B2|nr:hypothetical protein MONOS_10199 [Monocercomonoides exilis]|eukprot:MONOS_10199.1-p1 / transcript=MONOS_10199.1 / gene=MONOS_10199 / organism=Monocercomonoides_exilis_PA203 / gene_product=unspecified product / transcript_product=unspecified product / location=Mono_scaffold00453:40438-41365(-) / protein_length=293 / sequence_SO=supercontig / SO=protein_coding / is_pseudo=false
MQSISSDAIVVVAFLTSTASMEKTICGFEYDVGGGWGECAAHAAYGGVVCAYDVALSAMLSVPLVAPLPSLAASVGTKSGSKRIFEEADANALTSIFDLFDPSLLPSAIARLESRSPQSRRVVVKLDDEVMGRGVAVCEVGEIVEKGLDAAGLRMEDVVLSPAAIALAVLEEREEAEEGEKGDKEGEEKGEEKGEEDGGREEGDVNEVKGGYPTAHREFVERIKENQGKLEEAMAQMVVEALGLSGLRFVKADVVADKKHQLELKCAVLLHLMASNRRTGEQLKKQQMDLWE